MKETHAPLPQSPPGDLVTLAGQARLFLEQLWPEWHRLRGRHLPTPLSRGTCQTSALFLAELLRANGIAAVVAQGNAPDAKEGYFDGQIWQPHAWTLAQGYLLDITADQFGAAPVICCPQSEATAYLPGSVDTAFPSAKRQRAQLVEAALARWHCTFPRGQ